MHLPFKSPVCLLLFTLLSLSAVRGSAAEVSYPVLPDPTADDGVCRIFVLGHSFFVGEDDLVGMLPKMLEHQMGWEVDLEFLLTQAAGPTRAALVDEGLLPAEHGERSAKIWNQIKETLAAEDYDLIFFLDGTGSPHVAAKYEGYGMLHYRVFADALLQQEPEAFVLGLAVWPPSTYDYEQFAEEADLNMAAWRGAAGAESEAQRIFDLKVQDKAQQQPVYGILRQRWDELGQIDRFLAAPVAEAWKIAYAEKGIGNMILHRGIADPDPHGNLWGDYLKSCVFFSMITGEPFDGQGFTRNLVSPGHSKSPPHENKTNLPDSVARYLEDVAWRTVQRERLAMQNLLNNRPAGVEPVVPRGEPAQLIIRRTMDDHGFERLREYLSTEGEVSSRVLSEYDDRGTLTRRALLTPEDEVIQQDLYEPVYQEGKLQKYIQKDAEGKAVGQTIYAYDEAGNLTSEKQEDRKGQVEARYEFDYEQGRLQEKRFYNAAGELEATTRFEYDQLGRPLKEEERDQRDRPQKTVIYGYAADSPDAPPATVRRITADGPAEILRKLEYGPDNDLVRESIFRVTESGEEKLLRETRYQTASN